MIVIHHTVSCPDETTATDVHEWHLARGWAGIGYHFLVRSNGTVKRGRPQEMQGAHVRGRNEDTLGIAFAGNLQQDMPTDDHYQGAANLIAYLYKHHYGELPIRGHNDLAQTACPGANMDLGRLRNLVDQRMMGGGSDLSWQQEQAISEIKRLAEMGLLNSPEQHIEAVEAGEEIGDHVILALLRRIAEGV